VHRRAARSRFAAQVMLPTGDASLSAKLDSPHSEGEASLAYREQLSSKGSPSTIVAAGYRWSPGTELARKVVNL
jgi:hypothetical protein